MPLFRDINLPHRSSTNLAAAGGCALVARGRSRRAGCRRASTRRSSRLLLDTDVVLDVLDARDPLRDVLRPPLSVTIVDRAGERHLAGRHRHLDLGGIHVGIIAMATFRSADRGRKGGGIEPV